MRWKVRLSSQRGRSVRSLPMPRGWMARTLLGNRGELAWCPIMPPPARLGQATIGPMIAGLDQANEPRSARCAEYRPPAAARGNFTPVGDCGWVNMSAAGAGGSKTATGGPGGGRAAVWGDGVTITGPPEVRSTATLRWAAAGCRAPISSSAGAEGGPISGEARSAIFSVQRLALAPVTFRRAMDRPR